MANMKEEVTKTFNMLKDAGFMVNNMAFEGEMTVKGQDMLDKIDGLVAENKANGVIRIVYSAGTGQLRVIEIPVGELVPEMPEEE